MIELMLINKAKQGFFILELVIVLALIGVLGSMVIPNLFRSKQGVVRKEFLSSFESLLKGAVQQAVLTGKVYQVYINNDDKIVQTRVFDSKSSEQNKHKQFTKVNDDQYLQELPLPSQLIVKNFFIGKSDEVIAGSKLQDVWFYIMPDGSCQPILVNMIDQHDYTENDFKFSFVISPFYARMSVYESFQTP